MALIITIPNGRIQLQGTKIRVQVNTDNVQGSLYRILLKVSNADSKLDGLPQVSENTPDVNGDAEFDISGLLYRNFVPTFAESGAAIATERADIPCTVELDIGESYIDATSKRQENWSGLVGDQYKITVLQGGLNEHEQNTYRELGTNWYADFVQGGKWLSTLVNGVKIAPAAAAKLWYISPESVAQNLTLKADYVLQDGTSGTVSQAHTVNPAIMNEFTVDATTLGLSIAGDNPVTSYQVYLENAGVQILEKFLFTLDYNWYEFNTQVFATNKYGGVDPYWFSGKVENAFPAEHGTAQRTAQPTDTRKNRTQIAVGKKGKRRWFINTGHKSFAEKLALVNLILSRQIWLVVNNQMVPVNIENSEEALGSIFDNLHDFTFEFTEAHQSKY